jgi:hypothetical protein
VKNDGAFQINDIKLILEFKAKQPIIPIRTTYYYDSAVYNLVNEAVDSKYEGYTVKKYYELSTPALWYNGEGIEKNCLTEYNAKMFISDTNTYRLALRGKQSILSISQDEGKTYKSIITIKDIFINHYSESIEKNYYYDIKLKKGDIIYLKVVLLSADVTQCFFEIGCSTMKENNEFNTPTIITNTFKLYALVYEYPKMNSEYFISHKYTASNTVSPTTQTLISGENTDPWDDTLKIDHLFDGLSTTFFHSKKNNFIDSSNPFVITVDMGKNYLLNSILMVGRSANVNQSPKIFEVYGGRERNNLELIYSTPSSGSTLTNNFDISISFNITQLRYYKLVVTESYNQYVALNGIYPSISGTEHSPDTLIYKGEWRVKSAFSPYGHIYTSTNTSSTAEFPFTGNFIMIHTVAGEEQSYSISIDNGEFIEVNVSSTFEGFSFISNVLDSGKHTMIIKIKTRCIVASLVTQ